MSDATAVLQPSAHTDEPGPGERWRPSPAGFVGRVVVLAALLAVVLAIPHLVPDIYLRIVARAAVYGIIALSMNVLVGYTGQVSLGHAAFVGIGAFSAGIVLTSAELPYLAATAVAGLTGAIAALVLGGVALRVKGLYLAVVTIAYVLFTQNTLFNIRALTGGGAGQPVPRPGFATGDVAFIYLCYAVLALAWIFDWRLTASKAGRAIQALRDDERVAASWGINVTGYKLLAFVISGAMAGVAGALFGSIEEIATPGSFGLTPSITFLLMAVVGGLGSRPGVVQGGVVFATLATLLDRAHEHWTECLSIAPRVIQFVIGGGLAVAGLVVFVLWIKKRKFSLGQSVVRIIGGGSPLALGGLLMFGAIVGGTACMFRPITALYEPLIGAALLLLTLIFFPGGIAEQQEDLLRWLSFKRFHAPDTGHAVGGGTGGGGMGARS